MNDLTLTRRRFIVGTSVAGAGLTLGVLPSLASGTEATFDEVNAWVHIAPDDTSPNQTGEGPPRSGAINVAIPMITDALSIENAATTIGSNWFSFRTTSMLGSREPP